MNFHSSSIVDDMPAVALIPCKETGKQEMIEIEIERVKRRVYSVAIFNQRYTGIYRKQEVLKRNNKKLE